MNIDEAIRADEEYSAALVRQFGTRASRWTIGESEYNAETAEAFRRKVKADRRMRERFRVAIRVAS